MKPYHDVPGILQTWFFPAKKTPIKSINIGQPVRYPSAEMEILSHVLT
jgi:hypothetical protein